MKKPRDALCDTEKREWYINTTRKFYVAAFTTNRHVTRRRFACVSQLDVDSLSFGALSKCLTPEFCIIFPISSFSRAARDGKEEERIKRSIATSEGTRDTFENVYIFTMWHHPKKLRNRKINAKNRAAQSRLTVLVIVSLWLDDDFFKWDEKKMFMWHSGLFSALLLTIVVVVVDVLYKHEAVELWSPFQMFMYWRSGKTLWGCKMGDKSYRKNEREKFPCFTD